MIVVGETAIKLAKTTSYSGSSKIDKGNKRTI
jgi:hypothetical protein